MTNEQIKSTIDYFKENGETIRVRDIAFTLLSKMFADSKTAFQCLFGQDGYEDYIIDPIRDKINDHLTEEGFIKSFSTDAGGGITFEENRREMEELLRKTQQALDEGLMEPKDGLKIQADIRTKLNDKFRVEQKKTEQYVVVQKRYNSVCEHCHHEIYIPTVEDLKEQYGLIEKDKKE